MATRLAGAYGWSSALPVSRQSAKRTSQRAQGLTSDWRKSVMNIVNALSVAAFWAAVGIVAVGSAMVVRATHRNRREPAFDGLIVLVCIALVAAFVVAMPTTLLSGAASFRTVADTFVHSSAMQGGVVGAVFAWGWALVSVLVSVVAGAGRNDGQEQ
jgi:hypothetical protein